MKQLSLKVSILALSCLPAAFAGAAIPTTGYISNESTATANVYFNQDIDLTNTLTAVTNPPEPTDSHSTVIANGHIGIAQPEVKAELAVKVAGAGGDKYITYATGHNVDPHYELDYMVLPNGVAPENKSVNKGYSSFDNAEGEYMVSDIALHTLNYHVYALAGRKVAAGEYTINTTVGVYNL